MILPPALYLLSARSFGFVLSRSGAADYDYIQGMFLFERFQLYGIIGTAVVAHGPGAVAAQAPRPHVGRRAVSVDANPDTAATSSAACSSALAGRLPACARARSS